LIFKSKHKKGVKEKPQSIEGLPLEGIIEDGEIITDLFSL